MTVLRVNKAFVLLFIFNLKLTALSLSLCKIRTVTEITTHKLYTLENLTAYLLVNKFATISDNYTILNSLTTPSTCPCPKPDTCTEHPHIPFSSFFKATNILTLSGHLHLGLSSVVFFSALPIKVLYAFLISPTFVTFPLNLISADLLTLAINNHE